MSSSNVVFLTILSMAQMVTGRFGQGRFGRKDGPFGREGGRQPSDFAACSL